MKSAANLFLATMLSALFFIQFSSCKKDEEAKPSDTTIDYYDDFSDDSSGWYIYDCEDYCFGYTDNGYNLTPKRSNYMAWAFCPEEKISPFYEVEAQLKLTDSIPGMYGILFNYDTDGNFYFFGIDPQNQSYTVWRNYLGAWYPQIEWLVNKVLITEENIMKIHQEGAKVDFYINDEKVNSLDVISYPRGMLVGLIAGNFSNDDSPATAQAKYYRLTGEKAL